VNFVTNEDLQNFFDLFYFIIKSFIVKNFFMVLLHRAFHYSTVDILLLVFHDLKFLYLFFLPHCFLFFNLFYASYLYCLMNNFYIWNYCLKNYFMDEILVYFYSFHLQLYVLRISWYNYFIYHFFYFYGFLCFYQQLNLSYFKNSLINYFINLHQALYQIHLFHLNYFLHKFHSCQPFQDYDDCLVK